MHPAVIAAVKPLSSSSVLQEPPAKKAAVVRRIFTSWCFILCGGKARKTVYQHSYLYLVYIASWRFRNLGYYCILYSQFDICEVAGQDFLKANFQVARYFAYLYTQPLDYRFLDSQASRIIATILRRQQKKMNMLKLKSQLSLNYLTLPFAGCCPACL